MGVRQLMLCYWFNSCNLHLYIATSLLSISSITWVLTVQRACCGCCVYLLLQAKRKLTGIMNFTNPGAISHNEVR